MAETVIVVEQPNYIPWIGYFDLIAQSGVWVWYDDVQYTRRDWRNRNRVAAGGEPVWLTVPVRSRGRYEQPIHEVEIDYERPWARKHLATVRHCYGAAPFFDSIYEILREALDKEHRLLADLTIEVNEALCGLLGLRPRFLRSSGLDGIEGDKRERLIQICRRLDGAVDEGTVGGTVYLSGPAARDYIQPQLFRDAGIELRYIVYDYPPYDRGGQPFIPNLSILDPLAWLGPEATTAFLRRHARWEAG